MTRVSSRASVLFTTILLAATAFAQVNFTHQTYGTPNFPTDIFVADLNADGKDDIVVTEEDSNVVNVFLNHGSGTFTDQGSAQYLAGQNPEFVVVADINNDGKPDIVAAGGLSCFSQQSLPHVDLLLGNGDGTFQPPLETQLPQDECISGLALTKVNSANWDIAVTARNDVRLLLNNGSGPFILGNLIPGPNELGSTLGTISSADYNRDGHWDLAINDFSETGGSKIEMFLGDGTGHYTIQQLFTPQQAAGGSNVFFWGPWTVDLNGDGIADLLVPFSINGSGTVLQPGVIEAVNNGDGTFSHNALRVNSRFSPSGKASVGDLNGDGLRDIILPVGTDPASGNVPTWAFFRGLSSTAWAGAQYVHGNIGDNMEFTAVGRFIDGKVGFAGTGNSNDLTVWNVGGATPPPTCSAPTAAGVHVCSPAANATVTSPVAIAAAANGGAKPITAMKAYIDGKQVASSTSASLKASVPTAAGTHTLNVNAWNSAGTVFTFQSKFTVH
jgi:FG-GAP-like repeat